MHEGLTSISESVADRVRTSSVGEINKTPLRFRIDFMYLRLDLFRPPKIGLVRTFESVSLELEGSATVEIGTGFGYVRRSVERKRQVSTAL